MKARLPFLILILSFSFNLFGNPDTKQKEVNLSDLSSCSQNSSIPFKAKGDFISAWDGRGYTDLFLKGTNLGISVPGTQPGELAATSEQYRKWFKEIKEIGFNCIRLFTLHYPRFYDELLNYNLEHPENPLLILQGVWLDELSNFDLYSQTSAYETEIEYVVDCVHGNKTIANRLGKAHGTYSSDISQWVIGYIIGREVYPAEIATTNSNNSGVSSFNGPYLKISNGSPSEVWMTARMDKVISYEQSNYDTQRPVSFSSWASLDPISHPIEADRYNGLEDSEQVDFAKIDDSNAEAGMFVSYHAYPHYPEFISDDPNYQTEQDAFGPNSYLGYLKDLKDHFTNFPLLIAEFGVPSSWGMAHYASSKMHHGGISETQQGIYTIRMLDNMQEANLAGGIQFAWLDEWFKPTWITNPLTNADTRFNWHNIATPEQNFGLVTFTHEPEKSELIGSYNSSVTQIRALADPTFFNVTIRTRTEDYFGNDYWLAIDTYDQNLGESRLPNGVSITSNNNTLRAEFALKINLNDTIAKLYVTNAYDIFNIDEEVRLDTVVSTSTDGAAWDLVRWRTNYAKNNIQYIGDIKIEHQNNPYSFLSGVNWNTDSICIRLPWTLLNYRDPTQKEVMHYTSEEQSGQVNVLTRDRVSDGIALTLVTDTEKYQTSRFVWDNWNKSDILANPPIERQKKSVLYISEHLSNFNNSPFAECDSYTVMPNGLLEIEKSDGLLSNDYDYDGNELEVVQPFGYNTFKGNLFLHPDGSFVYEPNMDETGDDEFMYYASDGDKYSKLVTVTIHIKDNNVGTNSDIYALEKDLRVYPNPGNGLYQVKLVGYDSGLENLRIYNSTGQLVKIIPNLEDESQIDLTNQQSGIFYFQYTENEKRIVKRVVKI